MESETKSAEPRNQPEPNNEAEPNNEVTASIWRRLYNFCIFIVSIPCEKKNTDKQYNELFHNHCSIFAPLRAIKLPFTSSCLENHPNVFKVFYGIILCLLTIPIALPIYGFLNNTFCRRDSIHIVASIRNLCSIASVVAMNLAAWYGRKCPQTDSYCPDCYGFITKHIDQVEDGEKSKCRKCCCKCRGIEQVENGEESECEECQQCCCECSASCRCCQSFFCWIGRFVCNLFYTWFFLFGSVIYFTFLVPEINPNIHLYEATPEEWVILVFDFILASIRVYHIQFFCIICDRLSTKILCQLKPIVDEMDKPKSLPDNQRKPFLIEKEKKAKVVKKEKKTLDSKDLLELEGEEMERRIENHLNSTDCQQQEDHRNLIDMARRCIYIRKVIWVIDRKIQWFTLIGVLEFMLGISATALHFLYVLKKGANIIVILSYVPWILFRFFFIFYSFFKAFKISSTYKSYVTRYKNAFSSRLICTECPVFKDEFQYVDAKIFKREPSLTLGGFLRLGSPPVFTIISTIKAVITMAVIKIVLDNLLFDDEAPKNIKSYYLTNCYDRLSE